MSPPGPTHYEVLGIPVDATAREVRSAYLDAAKRTHPDAGGDAASFRRLLEAYETLTDADRRREYDERAGIRAEARVQAAPSEPASPGGTFTGDVEFPGWLRGTTDRVWEEADARATAEADDEAPLPPPADLVWWTAERVTAPPSLLGLLLVAPTAASVDGRNVDTGEVAWRVPFRVPPAGRAHIGGGKVVITDADGVVHLLDPGGVALPTTVFLDRPTSDGLAVGEGIAAMAEVNGNLAAVDLATPGLRWRARLAGVASHLPSFAEEAVFVATRTTVEAIDVRTGQHLWRVPLTRPLDLPPVATPGGVWVAGAGGPGTLAKLDIATGRVHGTIGVGQGVAGLVAVGDVVLVTSSGPARLLALDEFGRTRVAVDLDAPCAEPAVFGNVLHLADPTGTFVTVDLAAGTQVVRSVPFEPIGSPLVSADRIVMLARDGVLWGLVRPGGSRGPA